MAGIYERLGVRPAINGAATLTKLGGSLMPPPVLQAMREAAQSYVDIHDLQARAGRRIAELTHNEAAYISCGAAAGLVLSAVACVTGPDEDKIRSFTDWSWRGKRDQIIMHRAHRIAYDLAIRQTGVEIVEIGTKDGTTIADLEAAFSSRTVAVLFIAGSHLAKGALPLSDVVRLAHARGVSVVVDAAAQLPPPDNLWNFGRQGADLVLFSGGKGLSGPQSSGLILGQRELIEACRRHGSPNHAIGRPMKVGKEELAGIVAAVEWYLSLDHVAIMGQYESQVRRIVESMSMTPGVTAKRDFPSEAGQPMPRAKIELDESLPSPTQILETLESGDPPIYLSAGRDRTIFVNPQTLSEGEEMIVVDRLHHALRAMVAAR